MRKGLELSEPMDLLNYGVFFYERTISVSVIQLADLNGQNGFKIDGENSNDHSGWSVSAAGDINNDGVGDLLTGAYAYSSDNYKGRSYVVFGGPEVGNNGILALSG